MTRSNGSSEKADVQPPAITTLSVAGFKSIVDEQTIEIRPLTLSKTDSLITVSHNTSPNSGSVLPKNNASMLGISYKTSWVARPLDFGLLRAILHVGGAMLHHTILQWAGSVPAARTACVRRVN
jgi:hypothetical protein